MHACIHSFEWFLVELILVRHLSYLTNARFIQRRARELGLNPAAPMLVQHILNQNNFLVITEKPPPRLPRRGRHRLPNTTYRRPPDTGGCFLLYQQQQNAQLSLDQTRTHPPCSERKPFSTRFAFQHVHLEVWRSRRGDLGLSDDSAPAHTLAVAKKGRRRTVPCSG